MSAQLCLEMPAIRQPWRETLDLPGGTPATTGHGRIQGRTPPAIVRHRQANSRRRLGRGGVQWFPKNCIQRKRPTTIKPPNPPTTACSNKLPALGSKYASRGFICSSFPTQRLPILHMRRLVKVNRSSQLPENRQRNRKISAASEPLAHSTHGLARRVVRIGDVCDRFRLRRPHLKRQ